MINIPDDPVTAKMFESQIRGLLEAEIEHQKLLNKQLLNELNEVKS